MSDMTYTQIHKTLVDHVRKVGQRECARDIKCPTSTLHTWINAKPGSWTMQVCERIAQGLGLTVELTLINRLASTITRKKQREAARKGTGAA